MKRIIAALALATMAGLGSASAETKLLFNSFIPTTSVYYTHGIAAFKEAVETASEGRISIEITPATLAPADSQVEMLQGGVADLAIFATSWYPDQLLFQNVSVLPFSGESSLASSVALWRTHEKFFEPAMDLPGVKLLSLYRNPPKILFTVTKEIQKPEDMRGLKVQVVTSEGSQIFQSLHSIPLQRPQVQAQELLSGGVVDGTYTEYLTAVGFNIAEEVKYGFEMPMLGDSSVIALAMSEGAFLSLSEEDRAIITEAAGEAWARTIGGEWDNRTPLIREKLIADGIKIHSSSDDMFDGIKDTLEKSTAGWMEAVSRRNVDAAAARAFYLEQFEAVSKE